MVRKAALGPGTLVSLASSVLGTDPGQREESFGSRVAAVAATTTTTAAQEATRHSTSLCLADPGSQGKRASLPEGGA